MIIETAATLSTAAEALSNLRQSANLEIDLKSALAFRPHFKQVSEGSTTVTDNPVARCALLRVQEMRAGDEDLFHYMVNSSGSLPGEA
jgi:hypothetical protein